MKVPFTLGEVGHFGLAVRDPKESAKWFERALGVKRPRRKIAYSLLRTAVEAGTPLCAAHSKVPPLTRYLRALAFFNENDHCCIRKRGRERVRLARARLLVEHGARTLERLEMA